MRVTFEDRNGQNRLIGDVDTIQDFHVAANTFCDDRGFHIHYKRMWIDKTSRFDPVIVMDVGSHTEFFHLHAPLDVLERMLASD